MRLSVIVPVHNEEAYLKFCLNSFERVKKQVFEFIFILDRCTDGSEALVKRFSKARIVKKEIRKWKNSYAENLQIGLEVSKGDVVCIHDADIESPSNLLSLVKELHDDVASVSPTIRTYREGSFLNHLYYYWEETRRFAPFGEQPRGGVRFIRRECLEKVGGFKDVIAPDTQLDIDLRSIGYRSLLVKSVTCYHLRKFSFRKAIRGQIQSGKMRRQNRTPVWRVLGHAIFRLRPFVLYGYLLQEG